MASKRTVQAFRLLDDAVEKLYNCVYEFRAEGEDEIANGVNEARQRMIAWINKNRPMRVTKDGKLKFTYKKNQK